MPGEDRPYRARYERVYHKAAAGKCVCTGLRQQALQAYSRVGISNRVETRVRGIYACTHATVQTKSDAVCAQNTRQGTAILEHECVPS